MLILTSDKNNKTALTSQSAREAKNVATIALNLHWGCDGSTDTPIFTRFIPGFSNFYDKNDIDLTLRDGRKFSSAAPVATCGATRKFQNLDDLSGKIFATDAKEAGEIVKSKTSVKTSNKKINGENDDNFKEISIETTLLSKDDKILGKTLLKSYFANVGLEPEILSKRLP